MVDSCFAPKDVYEVSGYLTDEQKALIVYIGLGGMLDVDNITHVDREFSWHLLLNVDLERATLKIDETVVYAFNEVDIHNILGIALGGDIEIECKNASPTVDQLASIRSALGLAEAFLYVTTSDLKLALKRPCQTPLSDEYRVRTIIGFAMLCMATCFSPREKRSMVPAEAYEICMDHSNLHRVNWGKYIFTELIRVAARCQQLLLEGKAPHVYGCPLVLQVLYFDSVDVTAFVRPDPSVRPRTRFYTAAILSTLILGNTFPRTGPKKYGVLKATVIATENLPWDTTHVRQDIAEAKAFIERSLQEHALASTERNRLFFQRLAAVNTGTICYMNNNMRSDIEMHMQSERVMTTGYMQALLRYVDELGLCDSANELTNQLNDVAAQSGAYNGAAAAEVASDSQTINLPALISTVGVFHPVDMRLDPVGRSISVPVGIEQTARGVPVRMSMGSFGQLERDNCLPGQNRSPEGTEFASKLWRGEHLRYNVETCRLIFVPVKGGGGFHVLYVFDMLKKVVHVMDPKRTQYDIIELEMKHARVMDRLLFGLCKCIETFFVGWHVRADDFKRKAHRMMHEPSSSNDSPFFNVHYMMKFDGEYMTEEIWPDQMFRLKQQLMRFPSLC
uniref:Uncharacterized protein n=1 Tax=Hordeum vulgare subsp. vulgare TaxID=112509 RepID=A0A8I6YS37_HORVV